MIDMGFQRISVPGAGHPHAMIATGRMSMMASR